MGRECRMREETNSVSAVRYLFIKYRSFLAETGTDWRRKPGGESDAVGFSRQI